MCPVSVDAAYAGSIAIIPSGSRRFRLFLEKPHQPNGFQIDSGSQIRRHYAEIGSFDDSLSASTLMMSCKKDLQGSPEDYSPEKIIAMEKAALDRWGRGDPQGYFDAMAADITYFDPVQEKRLDGLERLKEFISPFVGKIKIDRYEMIDPKVQHDGNVAVLTFNLISYNKQSDGSEKVAASWNHFGHRGLIVGSTGIGGSFIPTGRYVKPGRLTPTKYRSVIACFREL